MTTPSLMPPPKSQFIDSNGNPIAGGKVYTYSSGTTTPKVTYNDSSGLSPNTNPIILDAAGRANIWLDGFYNIVVNDSNDTLVYSTDNVSGAAAAPQASAYVPWVLVSTYGDLASAITALGSVVPGMILIDTEITVSVNTTVTSNITLVIPYKSTLTTHYPINIPTGITLTINGPFMPMGNIRVFSLTGTGSVVFGTGSISEYSNKWVGDSTDSVPNNTHVTNQIGVRSYNTNPATGQPVGWICSVSGAPGTWKAMPGTYP